MQRLSKIICEYIWIGGKGEIRSKTKLIHMYNKPGISIFNVFPEWNYDASSTGQLNSDGNTECILRPVAHYQNPLRPISEYKNPNYLFNDYDSYLILCDTYYSNGLPTLTNNRHKALKIFNSKTEEDPLFGLEQEYIINCDNTPIKNNFNHYCGVAENKLEREIAETHMKMCLKADLNISGINSEVASKQWEFQIGPCKGINAADELIIARYLLERIAEQYNTSISFNPKPSKLANGSGCHTNFSTKKMREENGIEEIYKAINKLEKKHNEHMKVYGEENEKRLTGKHETASYKTFSWGKGTRNTSIRIPNIVVKEKCGYFEDRRPAANMDPYSVTSIIFKTCCLE